MLAERTQARPAGLDEPGPAPDRSMLVLQYGTGVIAAIAALLLAVLH